MGLEKNYGEILSKAGYKLTKPRREIMKVLQENSAQHLSAEEIHNKLREKGSKVGLATVYRTVETFCEIGLLNSLSFDEARKRYELEDQEDHHHHLICLSCGYIVEFSDDLLKDFMASIEKKYNFKVTDHVLKYLGYCQQCQKNNSSNPTREEK